MEAASGPPGTFLGIPKARAFPRFLLASRTGEMPLPPAQDVSGNHTSALTRRAGTPGAGDPAFHSCGKGRGEQAQRWPKWALRGKGAPGATLGRTRACPASPPSPTPPVHAPPPGRPLPWLPSLPVLRELRHPEATRPREPPTHLPDGPATRPPFAKRRPGANGKAVPPRNQPTGRSPLPPLQTQKMG